MEYGSDVADARLVREMLKDAHRPVELTHAARLRDAGDEIVDVAGSETGLPGTDVAAVNGGAISVTPLHLNMTHDPTSDALREALR